MKKKRIIRRVIEIHVEYDSDMWPAKAISIAVNRTVAEANSNCQYDGQQDGVEVISVTDAGPVK